MDGGRGWKGDLQFWTCAGSSGYRYCGGLQALNLPQKESQGQNVGFARTQEVYGKSERCVQGAEGHALTPNQTESSIAIRSSTLSTYCWGIGYRSNRYITIHHPNLSRLCKSKCWPSSDIQQTWFLEERRALLTFANHYFLIRDAADPCTQRR